MFQACNDPILEFRGQGSGKHLGRAQLLDFFDVLETMGPKAQPWKTRAMCNFETLFCGKGSEEVFERIWNQSEGSSIYPSVYLSLSIMFIYR